MKLSQYTKMFSATRRVFSSDKAMFLTRLTLTQEKCRAFSVFVTPATTKLNPQATKRLMALTFRFMSNEGQIMSNKEEILEIGIPAIKPLPMVTDEGLAVETAPELTTFADYGLGGWMFPNQWLHNLMEILHVDVGMPWVGTIMTTCVILRTIAIPFYAKMQAFNARSHNHLPDQMRLQMELQQCTSLYERQRKSKELMDFMQKHGTNPLTMLPFMLPTMLIFSSFFVAARKMAQVQLPSLQEGGALWFTDLTLADPYCILPFMTGLSLHLLVRFGGATAEGGPMADNPMFRKLFLYGPFVMVPFVAYQPAMMSVFWITSNFYSFVLMKSFQRPAVREYFGVPAKREYSPAQSLHMMRQQQEAMMSAMEKVKRHNQQMKKFSDEAEKRRKR